MLNRGLLGGIYSLTVVLGLLTVLAPAPSIWGVVGLHITYLYGILLVAGAAFAIFAILKPDYKLELIALWPIVGGYALYDIALWGLFADRVGVVDGLPPPYGPALAVAVLTLFLIAKIVLLYRKNREFVKASDNGRLE